MTIEIADKTIAFLRGALAPYFLGQGTFHETGTWTPTYLGGTTAGTTTYSFRAGYWTRLGNIIIAAGQINWSAATGTGEARISLPVTGAVSNIAGNAWISGVTFANSTPLALFQPSIGTYFVLDSPLTNAGNTRVQVEAVGSIIWTITYLIA